MVCNRPTFRFLGQVSGVPDEISRYRRRLLVKECVVLVVGVSFSLFMDGDVERGTQPFTTEYPSETVEVSASNRFTLDIPELSTEVTIDGRTLFDEHWTRRVTAR